MSATAIDRINAIRRRILSGEDVTKDEMAQVIQQIRGEREAPSKASTKRKTPAAPLDINALFGNTEEKK